MYHDYFSVEQYVREHHRELVAAAARDRLARAAMRGRQGEPAPTVRRPTLLRFALSRFGHELVTMGRRLEQLAPVGPAPRARAICEDQPTAAGC